MPQNGYWIECIPIATGDAIRDKNIEDFQRLTEEGVQKYRAIIASIPEAKVLADTPDQAIQKLRDKLNSLRHDYCVRGQSLPAHDNPIRPPRNITSVRGWMSVYVQMADCCKNH